MADLSQLAYQLAHGESRKEFAKLVKKAAPERAKAFTDVDQEERIDALRAELEQKEQLAEGRRIQGELTKQRSDLIGSGRYNEDQVKDIEKIIERHGSTLDYNTAAVLYAHENPASNPQEGPPPDQLPGATWEFPTVNGRDGKPIPFADFSKNPTAAAQNAAYQVITEFKRKSGIRA
jgi:hypothetical protein